MKKIFTFVVLILISFNFNNNAFSIEADVFVQSTVNRAAKTLGGGPGSYTHLTLPTILLV